jgi:hypothetical protein
MGGRRTKSRQRPLHRPQRLVRLGRVAARRRASRCGGRRALTCYQAKPGSAAFRTWESRSKGGPLADKKKPRLKIVSKHAPPKSASKPIVHSAGRPVARAAHVNRPAKSSFQGSRRAGWAAEGFFRAFPQAHDGNHDGR